MYFAANGLRSSTLDAEAVVSKSQQLRLTSSISADKASEIPK